MAQNELAKTTSLNKYLEMPAVVERLGQKLGVEEAKRFKAALSSAVSTNPILRSECDPETVVSSALMGHSLNLPPSPQLGYYYIVPYNNKKKGCKDGVFQMGYKGYVQLAMRSGYYKKLNVATVKKGEFGGWNPLSEDLDVTFIEDPVEREKADTVGYCGYFEYVNGFRKVVYYTLSQMQVHADKYSKAYSLKDDKLLKAGKIPQKDRWKYSSFWYSDFDAMGLKTVLRQLLGKWGSMSVEMQKAYEEDLKSDGVTFGQTQADVDKEIEAKAGKEVVAEFEPEKKTKAKAKPKTAKPKAEEAEPVDDENWEE